MSQTENKNRLTITQKIFIGLIAGIILGVLLHYLVPAGRFRDEFLVDTVFYFVGNAFIRLLQMLVVPLVFFSLATGALAMGDTTSLGKIGLKTLALYLLTTAAAIALALIFANIINPGVGMEMEAISQTQVDIAETPPVVDTLLNIIPTNPVAALAQGEMLQIILFALLVGIICAQLPDNLSVITKILNEGNDLMMMMTSMVMTLAPYGVFALIARTFTQLGFDSILPMISYMATVLGGLVAQFALVYIPMLLLLARLPIAPFLKKIIPPATFAFSSASSGATIPLTLQATDNMGIPRKISAFTIPLGATINMDGTAIMQGVAVVFIANVYGVNLDFADFMMVILTATLASVGTAAVPGVGLVTLSMVLTAVNLPVEGIAMIMGIDRILDMARTATNISGDMAVSVIVAKQAGMLDKDQYHSDTPVLQEEI